LNFKLNSLYKTILKYKLIKLNNLDNPDAKYLIPISLIKFLLKIIYKRKVKLISFNNLYNPNPTYLIPISSIILLLKNKLNLNLYLN